MQDLKFDTETQHILLGRGVSGVQKQGGGQVLDILKQ